MQKKISLLLLVLFPACTALAQYPGDSVCRQQPVWIAMMQTEGILYEDAIRAFEQYYSSHPIPETESKRFALETEGKANYTVNKSQDTLAFEYKQFLQWQRKVRNFLTADGHVMTAEQRIEQWRKLSSSASSSK